MADEQLPDNWPNDERGGLVRYDAMCRAIDAALEVDEVKNIRDMAAALEQCARIAKNTQAEHDCGKVRLRGERRMGEMLAEMELAKGNLKKGTELPWSEGVTAGKKLADIGITKIQSSNWQQLAALPVEQINAAMAKPKVPTVNSLLKKPRREKREREFAETTKKAMKRLGTKLYGVIYADPPWRFEPRSRDTGMDRSADNHYQSMELDDIKAMAIPAADDCVLFLWATAPMLPEALEVMEAWGFRYKSHCVWVKDRVGTGYWFRNKHELLLVGTRGSVPAPAPGEQYCSAIDGTVGKHSAKPGIFAEMIEDLFPNVPAIEMFARGERLGWTVWGAEA